MGEAMSYGVVGGVGLIGGTKPPRVEWTPQGGKPWGVVTEGDRVPGGDGPRWRGDENSPAIQAAADNRPEPGASHEYGKLRLTMPPGSQVIWVAEEGGLYTLSSVSCVRNKYLQNFDLHTHPTTCAP